MPSLGVRSSWMKQASPHIMLKFVGFHLCTQYLALWIKKEQSQIWTKALLFKEVALTEICKKKASFMASKPLQRIWVRKL